jgi:spore coat protein W
MDEKQSDLMSPEMAKIMVQNILKKHNITKENMAKISDEDRERFKELAKNFKAHVETLLNDQSSEVGETTNNSAKETNLKKRASLKSKLRRKRG